MNRGEVTHATGSRPWIQVCVARSLRLRCFRRRRFFDEAATFFRPSTHDCVQLALADNAFGVPCRYQKAVPGYPAPALGSIDQYSDPPLRKRAGDGYLTVNWEGRQLSMVNDTWARPSERAQKLAKMTSAICPPRDFAPCSPITQASASTTFDFPNRWTHDTGNAGFEVHGGSRGKRLETTQSQSF